MNGAGDLFILDTGTDRVRRVDAATGIITTYAGSFYNNGPPFAGDGGLATAARLAFPTDVAVDAAGNLFISDGGNFRIRQVDAATGIITTLAGDGVQGESGDGGPATAARFQNPQGLAVDATRVLIAEHDHDRVRVVDRATGIIRVYAGSNGSNFSGSFAGDGGPPTAAGLNKPSGLAVDVAGHLFIADSFNQRVREVRQGTSPTLTAASPPGGTVAVAYSYQFRANGLPVPTFAAASLPPGLTLDAATGVLSGTPTTAGSYTFTVTAANGGTPDATATVTVVVTGTAAGQTITFAALAPVTYGVPAITLSAAGGGSGNPVTFTVVSGPGTLTGTALRVTGAGDIVVEANQAGSASFPAAPPVRQTLRVNPARLVVTADNATATSGGALPALRSTLSGLVNGDTSAVLSGVTLTTTATSPSPAGTYPIQVAGGVAANYVVEARNGVLTLTALASPPTLVGFPEFAAGADRGSGTVTFYDPNQTVRYTIDPFPGFTGGVRTAAADFNGDGVADVCVGTGPGSATHLLILDGKTKAVLFTVDPFEAAFVGGVYVAAGDVTGDGVPDLVVTPDEGGGPRCDIYSGKGFGKVASFFGIDDPNFRGGARSAVGDVTGDGVGDLIVVAGFGGGPRVAGFDGTSLTGMPTHIFGDFFIFETALRNGVFITTGDIDGDGNADIIAGGGPGGGPRVFALSGAGLVNGNRQTQLANFFGGDADSRGGIRVSVKNLDADGRADLLVGSGGGSGSRLTAYFGKSIASAGVPAAALDFDAFPGFAGGVFVG